MYRIKGSEKMKICMLATCHITEDARIFHKEAVTLSKNHDITIIANGNKTREYEKSGIKHISLKGELSAKNYPPRFINLFIQGYKNKPDVYHCHEPGSLLIGVILSKIHGSKVVYDVHENWGSLTATSSIAFKQIQPLIEPYVILMENLLVPHAACVISVSESVQMRLRAYNDNHILVYNYPLLIDSDTSNNTDRLFDCVYTGAVSVKRGSAILKQVAEMDKNIRFNIIGESDISMPDNVTVTGWVPFTKLEAETLKSKIGLVLFQPNHCNNIIGLPQKLFEYMHCGIPVIAPDFPEIRQIVNKANCGILVDVTSPESIYKAIRILLDNPDMYKTMGENARRFIENEYNWKTQEAKLLQVYERIES